MSAQKLQNICVLTASPSSVARDGLCFSHVSPAFTGLYIGEDNDEAPERFRGLGVRIEDDVLIREKGGPLILSSDVPKTIADVEQACAQG